MLLGHTDTTKPAPMRGTDRLVGFSGGGHSTSGEIFDAVFDDAEQNNSLFGLHQGFQDIYTENSHQAYKLAGQNIPGFETLRFKDIAESLTDDKALGDEDQGDYTIDLDLVNQKLKKLKETHPEIQTFEEMFAALKVKAKATEMRAQDVLGRADTFGDVVGFMSGMAGAFNKNDPLNIASLPLGGWGKTAITRIATEMGVGGLTETINQFLGVRSNRELLGLDNSTWRSVQQILFAAGGAGVFRGAIEGAPVVGRAVERKVAPNRAAGRELLRALEDVGVPVRSEEFLDGLVIPYAQVDKPSTRAAKAIISQEAKFTRDNRLGDTPEGVAEHYKRASDAAEKYRAGLENEMNGVETPRTSIFDDMNLRGVEETRGVPVRQIQETLDAASKDLDVEINAKTERIGRLEDDVVKIGEKLGQFETTPFSEFLRQVSPQKADELAQIEQQKAIPDLGKTRRSRLAKAENTIRKSPEGQQAAENRKADVVSGNKERDIQTAKVQAEQKEIRALELRRTRVRDKAQKAIDTEPKKILTPAEDKARAENVKLVDAEAPRIPGIGERGGLSPSQHVQATMARLEATDVELPKRIDETVARVERSFDEVDGTFDIGANRRVSGDMKITLDDGTSMTLREHLDDIKENERVVEAVRSCAI
tara:strand:- start:2546 stop:4495 length:1950 start_codon:yes stop_codon:yes gene_type:complete